MRRDMPTGSRIGIAMLCLGEEVFDTAKTTNPDNHHGSLVHEFLYHAKTAGREKALAGIEDDEFRAKMAAVDLNQIPLGVQGEISIAWDVQADTARVLGQKLNRDYSKALPGEIVITLDLAGQSDGAGDRIAIGADYKTGNWVGEVKDNWQARFGSLAIARVVDADSAHFSMLYLSRTGQWSEESATFDAFDLSDFADQLRALVKRIEDARRRYEETKEIPPLHIGDHCTHCDSLRFCPAQHQLARSIVPELQRLETALAEMSAEDLGSAYAIAERAEGIVDIIKSAARARAHQEPIPLPNGKVLREVPWSSRGVDSRVALGVLSRRIGDRALEAAKVSVAGIERALEASDKTAEERKEILSEIEREGGIFVTKTKQIRQTKKA